MGLFKRKSYVPTGRVGYYEEIVIGAGLLNKNQRYKVLYTVEEIEQLNEKSRVKVLDVHGFDQIDSMRSQVIALIDGIFIPSSLIEWKD